LHRKFPRSPFTELAIIPLVLWVRFQDQLSVGMPVLKDLF
jgi:hypothetical protein